MLLLIVKKARYIGFCVYGGSYLICPPPQQTAHSFMCAPTYTCRHLFTYGTNNFPALSLLDLLCVSSRDTAAVLCSDAQPEWLKLNTAARACTYDVSRGEHVGQAQKKRRHIYISTNRLRQAIKGLGFESKIYMSGGG